MRKGKTKQTCVFAIFLVNYFVTSLQPGSHTKGAVLIFSQLYWHHDDIETYVELVYEREEKYQILPGATWLGFGM